MRRLWVRLALAFGLLVGLQLATAAVARWQLAATGQRHQQLDTLAALQQQVAEWASLTRLNVSRALSLAKAGSPPALAGWLDGEMKQTSARISELHKTIEPAFVTPQQKAALAEVAAARQRYITLRGSLLARLGRPAEAAAATLAVDAELLPNAAAYLQTLERVNRLLEDEHRRQAAELVAVERRAHLLLTVLALSSLLVGLALSVAVARSITRPVGQATAVARRIAEGDLAATVPAGGRDETGQLLAALDAMQARLRSIVAGIRQGTESVGVATGEIASGNQDLSARTEQAASNLQQTAATMSALTQALARTAGAAQEAGALARSAAEVAGSGGAKVDEVVQTMSRIHAGSDRIGQITGVIDGIAFQTNMLALNAAVEAARAGEQGRGFAVVAGEVRALAQRSADAARQIKGLVSESASQVEAGTRLVGDAGETMRQIVAQVRQVSETIARIGEAATQQSAGVDQVGTAVAQLDQMTQQNAALVEQLAAAAGSLETHARQLAGSVQQFRTEPGLAAAARAAGSTGRSAPFPASERQTCASTSQ